MFVTPLGLVRMTGEYAESAHVRIGSSPGRRASTGELTPSVGVFTSANARMNER
jgi:hypothetical protein